MWVQQSHEDWVWVYLTLWERECEGWEEEEKDRDAIDAAIHGGFCFRHNTEKERKKEREGERNTDTSNVVLYSVAVCVCEIMLETEQVLFGNRWGKWCDLLALMLLRLKREWTSHTSYYLSVSMAVGKSMGVGCFVKIHGLRGRFWLGGERAVRNKGVELVWGPLTPTATWLVNKWAINIKPTLIIVNNYFDGVFWLSSVTFFTFCMCCTVKPDLRVIKFVM